MTTDPIADMLTKIRNAVTARHDAVLISNSKLKLSIVGLLKREGFIGDLDVLPGPPGRGLIKIRLKYWEGGRSAITNLRRVSKPGLRIYVQRGEIPRVYGGRGIAILSTPKGVLTGQQAWRQQVGGELLCYVW